MKKWIIAAIIALVVLFTPFPGHWKDGEQLHTPPWFTESWITGTICLCSTQRTSGYLCSSSRKTLAHGRKWRCAHDDTHFYG